MGDEGYPEKAGRIGQTDYWYEDEWTSWLKDEARQAANPTRDEPPEASLDDLSQAA